MRLPTHTLRSAELVDCRHIYTHVHPDPFRGTHLHIPADTITLRSPKHDLLDLKLTQIILAGVT